MAAQSKGENERLSAELVAASQGTETIQGDGGQWRVGSRDYAERMWAGGIRYVHNVELRESADLTVDRVEFGVLALVPDRWNLDEGTGSATFTLLATLDADQHQHFQRFHGQVGNSYFPVTWGGTSHQPVSMRFGQCLWEAANGGGARHLVNLVAQEGDTQQAGASVLFDPLFDPWKQRLIEQSVRIRSGFDALLSELEQAGVLGGEAIGRIKDSISNPDVSGVREFDRVYGIEDYFK